MRKLIGFAVMMTSFVTALQAESSQLSESDRAKWIAARHLIHLRDDATASALKRKDILSLPFPSLKPELSAALAEVSPDAKPDVLIKVAVRGLAPLPIVPSKFLPPAERKRIETFAAGALRRFSNRAFDTPRDFEDAVAELALDAGTAFQSSMISEGFNDLGELSLDTRLNEREIDLVDAKDRLNALLHLWGLHLVLDLGKEERRTIKLSAYQVENARHYVVFGNSFSIYEVNPLVELEVYPVLGHAEVEEGFLFIFSKAVDEQLALMPGQNRDKLIDSIGHHEGYHKYFEPVLNDARRRGTIGAGLKTVLHETGAYLYQIESADPSNLKFDLALIGGTARADMGDFSANKRGAQLALERLGKTEGKTPDEIKSAAARAREKFEVDVRNGIKIE